MAADNARFVSGARHLLSVIKTTMDKTRTMYKKLQTQTSLAWTQSSLGPGSPIFPLEPVINSGCPITSSAEIQYPLEVLYKYDDLDKSIFQKQTMPTLEDWAPLLPPLAPKAAMGVGGTPLVDISEISPRRLRDRGVFLKDESRNPTWSHKDRLNACTVSAAVRSGARAISVASSGNHGVSAAAHAHRAQLKCIIVTTTDINISYRRMMDAYGAYVLFVPREERWAVMRMLAVHEGIHAVSNLTRFHTGHPWGPEGYKTIAYELWLQLDRMVPAALVVPTGYGELLYGIFKGFRELVELKITRSIPQMISVEPTVRGPLHHALANGLPSMEVRPMSTLLNSISSTVSSYRGVVAIRESKGQSLLVSDEEALTAQRELAWQGLWQEVSSSAAFAALTKFTEVEQEGPIVVVGTSCGLKGYQQMNKSHEINPDIQSVVHFLKSEYGFQL